ncbi:MAG: HIT family protein [Actinomycetales bacterium]
MSSGDETVEIVAPAPGAGVPDEIERLWTPQRMAYIRGEGKPPDAGAGDGCPFCRVPQLPDEEGYVVARGEHVFAVLNLYPYSPGHVLVCPYVHVASYLEIEGDTLTEFTDFTRRAIVALRKASSPHGFNLGMNQGAVAGAGIAAHLHQHVVPRWGGDANFMPIVARTKPLPELLGDTWRRVRDAWPDGA